MSEQERQRRFDMWAALIESGGPYGVSATLLRDLDMYKGQQGIWVDKSRTASITHEGTGVTVAILHTGSSYPDDISDDGVLYHYPNTNRPKSRDLGEIDATKAAGRLSLPVFVITYPTPSSSVRNINLGWVEGWDDESELFLVTFGNAPPPVLLTEADDTTPFEPFQPSEGKTVTRQSRPNQQRFRFQVVQRYGPYCAVCDISSTEVLDAAHLIPNDKDGSYDPRNGLVLCATHHRAMERKLFGLNPQTLEIVYQVQGPNEEMLRITRPSLAHLRRKPHPQALEWLWNQFKR